MTETTIKAPENAGPPLEYKAVNSADGAENANYKSTRTWFLSWNGGTLEMSRSDRPLLDSGWSLAQWTGLYDTRSKFFNEPNQQIFWGDVLLCWDEFGEHQVVEVFFIDGYTAISEWPEGHGHDTLEGDGSVLFRLGNTSEPEEAILARANEIIAKLKDKEQAIPADSGQPCS